MPDPCALLGQTPLRWCRYCETYTDHDGDHCLTTKAHIDVLSRVALAPAPKEEN